jgi:hypothetical protein
VCSFNGQRGIKTGAKIKKCAATVGLLSCPHHLFIYLLTKLQGGKMLSLVVPSSSIQFSLDYLIITQVGSAST